MSYGNMTKSHGCLLLYRIMDHLPAFVLFSGLKYPIVIRAKKVQSVFVCERSFDSVLIVLLNSGFWSHCGSGLLFIVLLYDGYYLLSSILLICKALTCHTFLLEGKAF